LEGISKNRFTRIYGKPNEVSGDSLIYHMDRGCIERKICNAQIFEFNQEKLVKVHLIQPWGRRSVH
jgi:hypothetical protein